jgi:hypothetical protein
LMIFDLVNRFFQTRYNTLFLLILIFSVIIPSFIISTTLITSTTNDFHVNVISAISKEVKNFNLKNNNNNSTNFGSSDSDQKINNNNNNKLTVLGTNYWLWIPKYILDTETNMYKNNFIANDIKTNNILLVAGDNFIKTMTRANNTKANVMQLKEIYSESNLISKFEQNTSKSIETNGSFDLDPKGSKKIELRKIY